MAKREKLPPTPESNENLLDEARILVDGLISEGYTNVELEDQKVVFDVVEDGKSVRKGLYVLPHYGPGRGSFKDELKAMCQEYGIKK